MGDPKDMPPPKTYGDEDSWKLAKQFGAPDLILKSDAYTMPAHGQDVWFKPYTDVNITGAAVGARGGNPAVDAGGSPDFPSRAGAAIAG